MQFELRHDIWVNEVINILSQHFCYLTDLLKFKYPSEEVHSTSQNRENKLNLQFPVYK